MSEAQTIGELCLTIEDVAKRLSVSDQSVRKEIQDGKLRAIMIRSAIRVPESALAEYIAAGKYSREQSTRGRPKGEIHDAQKS